MLMDSAFGAIPLLAYYELMDTQLTFMIFWIHLQLPNPNLFAQYIPGIALTEIILFNIWRTIAP
jgi:hypothetical protein